MRRPNRATDAAVLAVAVLLGVAALASPRETRNVSDGDFQLSNAIRHVEAIAQGPHPMGSPESVRVRDYLVATLERLGLETQRQTFTAPDYYGTPGNTLELANIMAWIPGTDPTGTIVLMAHHDTVPWTPGANDNSANVAAVLEAARALTVGEPLANDVIVLFTDGEEPYGRAGANTFIDQHPWAADVAFVMNFEAAGGSGPSILAQTGRSQAWTVEQLSSTPRPVAFSFVTELVGLMGELGTDFDPFLALGTEGVHFAYLRGGSIYHTERDSLDALNRDGVLHQGSYAVGLARHLGDVDLDSIPSESASTFFSVWPGGLVRYSTGMAIVVALLAAAAAITAAVTDVRRRGRSPRRVAMRAGWVIGGALAGSLVGGLAWMGIAALRPSMGSVEAYAYLALLVAVGLGIRLLLSRRFQAPDAVGGVMLAWAFLAVASLLAVPGASYLFAWPVIAASVGYLSWTAPDHNQRVLRLAVVAGVTALVMVPAVDVFLSLSQPSPGNLDSEMTEVFVVVAFLAILCLELLLPFLRAGRSAPEPDEASIPAEELVAA